MFRPSVSVCGELARRCLPTAEPRRAVLGGGSGLEGWGQAVSQEELRSAALAPAHTCPWAPCSPKPTVAPSLPFASSPQEG